MVDSRRCLECGLPFDLKPKGQTKQFCDRTCYLANWRAKNREKLREYSNQWLHNNQARHTKHNREWRQRRPEAATAHTLVYKAVKAGKLLPEHCEVCAEPRVHAHHDDYSKPLKVRWLCVPHHEAVHHG